MAVIELSESIFDDTIKSGVTLVDFWATWCGPCKMMGPILEKQVAPAVPDAKVCKVDVDQNPDLAARFGIQSIPALLVFKDGELKKQFIGLQKPDAVIAAIKEQL